jgi:hypothetical protein
LSSTWSRSVNTAITAAVITFALILVLAYEWQRRLLLHERLAFEARTKADLERQIRERTESTK